MQLFQTIDQFMQAGGPVLNLIAVVAFLMWTLIIERIVFHTRTLPKQRAEYLQYWSARDDYRSWHAVKIRQLLASRINLSIGANMKSIKTLIALCPLLGLLGTVWGMIEVFNALSVTAGDAKAMASGVSKATIPTMAGMVAALSGMFALTFLERMADTQSHLFEDSLVASSDADS